MSLVVLLVIGLLFLLLFNGMPVAFAMLVAGAVGIFLVSGGDTMMGVIGTAPYEHVASFTLSTLPMFVLMAELLTAGRFTGDIFQAFYRWAGHILGDIVKLADSQVVVGETA